MAITPVNSEDRLVQATFAEHLERVLAWESVYAWNQETFGLGGTLGRADTKEAVLTRDLRAALERLNPDLPTSAIDGALRELTVYGVSRSMLQHNRDFYRLIRGGVPVEYRDSQGHSKPKPRWDVHLPWVGIGAGIPAEIFRPLIAGWCGSGA